MSAPEPPTATTCRRCERVVTELQAYLLWDGNYYCHDCISAVDEDLIGHAVSCGVIDESWPFSYWEVSWCLFALLCKVVGSSLFVFAIVVAVTEGLDLAETIGIILLLGISSSVFTAVFSFGAASRYTHRRPFVVLNNGELSVGRGEERIRTAPISDCEWFASANTFTSFGRLFVPSRASIVLVLPGSAANHEEFISVGFTEESRCFWISFLTLAGPTRRTAWERSVPWPKKMAVIALLIGCPILVIAGASAIAQAVENVLGSKELGFALGLVVFVSGTLCSIGAIAMYWAYRAHSAVPSRRSAFERTKIRTAVVALCQIPTVYVAVHLMPPGFVDWKGMLVGVVLAFALNLMIGWHLGDQIATYERANVSPNRDSDL